MRSYVARRVIALTPPIIVINLMPAAVTTILCIVRRVTFGQNFSVVSTQGEVQIARTAVAGAGAAPAELVTTQTEGGDSVNVFKAYPEVGWGTTQPTASTTDIPLTAPMNVLTGYERAYALNDPDAPKIRGTTAFSGCCMRIVLPGSSFTWVVEIAWTEMG